MKRILTEIKDKIDEVKADIENRIDKAQENIEDKIEYQSSFSRFLSVSHLPKSFSQEKKKKSRFHYLNDRIGFHGREKERQQVKQFLECKKDIAVWGITGKGGVGKSKFARYICESNMRDFIPVWLTDDVFKSLEGITQDFVCDKTLLYVCDYADEKIERVKKIIVKMNDNNVRSRFLLLVREKEQYMKWNTDSVLSDYHFNPIDSREEMIPLDLYVSSLDEDSYKEIIEDYRKAYYSGKALSKADIKKIMGNATQIISEKSKNKRASRCLFVLLIADGYLSDPTNKCIDDNALVTTYFQRTKDHLKTNQRYTDIIPAGFRLLAFATMSNGLILDSTDSTLPKCVKDDIIKIEDKLSNDQEEISAFLNKLSDGVYDSEDNKLHPYEPDIIGEFLVLQQYFNHLRPAFKKQWREYLNGKIERKDPSAKAFVSRCVADWNELGKRFQIDLKK